MSKSSIDIMGDKAVLTLKQDLVATTVNNLRETLKSAIEKGVRHLSIDISKINIVDSMGIGLLISTQNSLSPVDGALEITGISEDIMDLFKSMRLDQHFSLKGE